VKVVRGEGMPIESEEPLDYLKSVRELPKGDLYVRFEIEFPKKLSNEHKQRIVEVLRSNEEEND
jgi:DnaJ-class molecular chaperone